MNHVSLTGPQGYRHVRGASRRDRTRRKKEEGGRKKKNLFTRQLVLDRLLVISAELKIKKADHTSFL